MKNITILNNRKSGLNNKKTEFSFFFSLKPFAAFVFSFIEKTLSLSSLFNLERFSHEKNLIFFTFQNSISF